MTVSMTASDVVVLSAYTDGSRTYPITNVSGSNCTIVNNNDGTWTIRNVSADTTITVTVNNTGVVTPNVTVANGTITVTNSSTDPMVNINAIIDALVNAGYARTEISVSYTTTPSTTYTVTTTQNGITFTWNMSIS